MVYRNRVAEPIRIQIYRLCATVCRDAYGLIKRDAAPSASDGYPAPPTPTPRSHAYLHSIPTKFPDHTCGVPCATWVASLR